MNIYSIRHTNINVPATNMPVETAGFMTAPSDAPAATTAQMA